MNHVSPERPILLWHELTSAEAETLVASDPVVILPVAAVEQHGPHLPLSTDLEIARGLLAEAFRRLPADVPARVLPPLAIGSSLEHEAMPGTVSLPAGLLEEILVHVGRSVARTGVRRVVVVNSHGGNQAPVERAALRLRVSCGLLVVKAYYPRFSPPGETGFPEAEWRHGLHGGAVETSMMLHLRPDLVQMDRIVPAASLGEELEAAGSRIGPQGPVPFAWVATDLSRTGVTGNPALATAGAGARLVAHYGAVLAEVVRDARAFPLERLAPARDP
jgi:creatinine amidohydrolase